MPTSNLSEFLNVSGILTGLIIAIAVWLLNRRYGKAQALFNSVSAYHTMLDDFEKRLITQEAQMKVLQANEKTYKKLIANYKKTVNAYDRRERMSNKQIIEFMAKEQAYIATQKELTDRVAQLEEKIVTLESQQHANN